MKALEDIEHGTVLVLEESAGYPDFVVRRDPDEILIERAVMDRAKTQSICHCCGAGRVRIAQDVSGVKQSDLFRAGKQCSAPCTREGTMPRKRAW